MFSSYFCGIAKHIWQKYFTEGSLYEVNIAAIERDVIAASINKPHQHMFDAVQQSIFGLMRMDSFPKFINSELYKRARGMASCPYLLFQLFDSLFFPCFFFYLTLSSFSFPS